MKEGWIVFHFFNGRFCNNYIHHVILFQEKKNLENVVKMEIYLAYHKFDIFTRRFFLKEYSKKKKKRSYHGQSCVHVKVLSEKKTP